ncbi:MAG: MFS transporter [Bryobacteraceae bacterium]
MSRWIPAFTFMLVSFISYVDRNTLALLSPMILKETGLSVESYGWIISAFAVCYMIGNPVWGVVLDRVGLRQGMTASVGFWTLASAAHAFATGFWSFAAARAALGFGEGATFPGGLRASVQSLPAHLQSRGMAVSYSGGSLGAIVTPLVVTPIALWYGWRGAFWFTGFVGLSWLLLWMFVGKRRDMRGVPMTHTGMRPRVRWKDVRVWAFMAAYAFGSLPIAFVLYQSAIYLNRVLGASQKEVGAVLWIPPLGWELGYFAWGWLTDRALRSGGSPLVAFRNLMGASMLLSLPLAAAPYTGSFALVVAQLALALFVCCGFIVVPVRYATREFSSANAGLIAGMGAGSWSALVAVVMPGFGWLFDRKMYHEAFLVAALAPVLGMGIWTVLSSWRAR